MLSLLRNLLVITVTAAATTCTLQVAIAAAAPEITDRSEILFVYDMAADSGRFDEALRYAVAGCERLRVAYLCREVADLPLQMASQGIVVPSRYGAELRRVADNVCFSDKPFSNGDGLNITGFVCGYYALQFARSHSPQRQSTFLTRAWQYLDSIHDPSYANGLFKVACKHGKANACIRVAAQAGGQVRGGHQ